jgi:hypothetical protein
MPTNKEFAEMANPHSWFLVADNLYEQASRLRDAPSLGILGLRSGNGAPLASWPVENRSVFLLAGFALENAIKAFLVYQSPALVSNGRLSRTLRSHKLVKLSKQVERIPWPVKGTSIIQEFERGLDSWARYPCALSASESEWEQVLPDPLWREYKRLMRAYGKRLRQLLQRGWDGPYGSGGKWEIVGDFLGTP